MDTANIQPQLSLMKDASKKIPWTEKAESSTKAVKSIKETSSTVKNTAMGPTDGPTIPNFRVFTKMTPSTASENIQIRMERSLKVDGSMEKDKAKAQSLTKTKNTTMTGKMARHHRKKRKWPHDFIGFSFIYIKNRKLQDNILNSMCFDQKALFANINAQTAFVRYLISDLKDDLCSIQVPLS